MNEMGMKNTRKVDLMSSKWVKIFRKKSTDSNGIDQIKGQIRSMVGAEVQALIAQFSFFQSLREVP